MADITEVLAAGTTKIVGSDSTGVEQTPVNSSPNGELYTTDVLRGTPVYGPLTVGLTAVEVKVGTSVLTNRRFVLFQNLSNKDIYFGFDNAVTTSTGLLVSGGSERTFEVTDNIRIWVISGTAGLNCRIAEVS